MELLEYLRIIKKRLWLILLITIAATAVSAGLSMFVISPVYEAKTSLIIGRVPESDDDWVRYDDVLMYQQLVKTYSELAKSRLVIDETLSRLNYNMTPQALLSNLEVTPKADTQIIEVAVQDLSPDRAASLVNTLSQVFIEKTDEMMNSDDVKIMDKAEVPQYPVKPNVFLNTAIAFLLGLMVSLGIVFLLEYLDTTLRTEDDIEKYLAVTVLANIPYVKMSKK